MTSTLSAELAGRLDAARDAALVLAPSTGAQRDAALEAIAEGLLARSAEIVAANAADLDRGRADGQPESILDRLALSTERVAALAAAVRDIRALPDPLGQSIRGHRLSNGLSLQQLRVPFGVVGVIYEARPNVTADIAALALKSGNAAVLRGGTAAQSSNEAIVAVIRDALESVGLPATAVTSIDDLGRAGAAELMRARGRVDVLVPRGSAALIEAVVTTAQVPVIETGSGIVHIVLDASARADWALEIVRNAKVQRPSVCNAVETLLVHADAAERLLPAIADALRADGVSLHGDERARALVPQMQPATEEDWAAEYLSLDLAVRIVDDLDAAIAHIRQYSSGHTESLITEDQAAAERFLAEVDSAVVLVNASTRFTDGGEFGFGAEVGISTQKLHARGPMGVSELTSTKWIGRGAGQVRH